MPVLRELRRSPLRLTHDPVTGRVELLGTGRGAAVYARCRQDGSRFSLAEKGRDAKVGDGKTPEAARSESGERLAGNGAPDVAARRGIAPNVNKEALSACVEAAPLAMLIIDRDGGIVLMNARAEQMFGYGREELIGQSIEVLVPAALRDTHVKHRAGYSADPPVRPMGSGRALAARRKDGSEFVAEIGLGFARFDGEAIAFATVIDITERKQTEDTLRESEQRFRSLYELASDAFLNVLPDGEIIDANNAAAKLLGYTAGELRGLTGADIIAPEVFEETEQAWREQLAQRGQFLVDTLWVRKDGSRVPVAVSGKRTSSSFRSSGGTSPNARRRRRRCANSKKNNRSF